MTYTKEACERRITRMLAETHGDRQAEIRWWQNAVQWFNENDALEHIHLWSGLVAAYDEAKGAINVESNQKSLDHVSARDARRDGRNRSGGAPQPQRPDTGSRPPVLTASAETFAL